MICFRSLNEPFANDVDQGVSQIQSTVVAAWLLCLASQKQFAVFDVTLIQTDESCRGRRSRTIWDCTVALRALGLQNF